MLCWKVQCILLEPGKFTEKIRSLNCQLISNSVIQIHSFCLVGYYAGLALIVLVLMVGKADGQDFFLKKQLVSIFFCSITCFECIIQSTNIYFLVIELNW